MQIGADGMVEFPDLTELELDFRALLGSPRRLREFPRQLHVFARECRDEREASGQAAEDRKRYAALAGKKGWT